MLLEVEDLEYAYNAGTPLEVRAVEGISFTLPQGEALGILGGTGSGKTTLVKNLNGLLTPTAGRVLVDGTDIRDFGPDLRKRIGVVFQRPERQLFEETVYKDISFVLRRFTDLPDEEIRRRVRAACQAVALDPDEVGDRAPAALTDGQRRKAAIAAILVNEPHILILDEPVVGLDPPSVAELVALLERMEQSRQRSLIIVSHDMEVFLPVVDRLMVLNHGRTAALGTPADVCEEVGDDPAMRELLPPLALLVHDLRKAGVPLDRNEFRVTVLAERLAGLRSGSR
jgi:energy-coupling factor transport system ATP-binding protein